MMTTRKRIYLAIAIITLIGLGNVLAQTQFKDQRSRAPRQHELEHDSRARSQACAAVLRFTSARHGFARRWHRTGNRCARGNENSAAVRVARTHSPLARRACPNHRRRDTTARRRSRKGAGPLHPSQFCTAAATARLPQVDLSAAAALSRLTGRRRDPHRTFADRRGALQALRTLKIILCGRQACNQKR